MREAEAGLRAQAAAADGELSLNLCSSSCAVAGGLKKSIFSSMIQICLLKTHS